METKIIISPDKESWKRAITSLNQFLHAMLLAKCTNDSIDLRTDAEERKYKGKCSRTGIKNLITVDAKKDATYVKTEYDMCVMRCNDIGIKLPPLPDIFRAENCDVNPDKKTSFNN